MVVQVTSSVIAEAAIHVECELRDDELVAHDLHDANKDTSGERKATRLWSGQADACLVSMLVNAPPRYRNHDLLHSLGVRTP